MAKETTFLLMDLCDSCHNNTFPVLAHIDSTYILCVQPSYILYNPLSLQLINLSTFGAIISMENTDSNVSPNPI